MKRTRRIIFFLLLLCLCGCAACGQTAKKCAAVLMSKVSRYGAGVYVREEKNGLVDEDGRVYRRLGDDGWLERIGSDREIEQLGWVFEKGTAFTNVYTTDADKPPRYILYCPGVSVPLPYFHENIIFPDPAAVMPDHMESFGCGGEIVDADTVFALAAGASDGNFAIGNIKTAEEIAFACYYDAVPFAMRILYAAKLRNGTYAVYWMDETDACHIEDAERQQTLDALFADLLASGEPRHPMLGTDYHKWY